MKLLIKLFPHHSTGTAGFISVILITCLILAGITLNDTLVREYPWYNIKFQIGCIGVFLVSAGVTYIWGKKE